MRRSIFTITTAVAVILLALVTMDGRTAVERQAAWAAAQVGPR